MCAVCVFTPQKETPLSNAVFWAARKGNLALLQLLLNSGRVDADCRDSVGTLHVLAAPLHALTIDRGVVCVCVCVCVCASQCNIHSVF